MGINIERLDFDSGNPTQGPEIGAFIVSSSGNVIDDTSGALDVYLANASIVVTATDLDIRDLSSAQDSVEIKTAAGQALSIDGSGYITVNQGTSPWVVSATDLDIRDLSYTQDSVQIIDAGGDALAINADGSLNVNLTDDNVADDEVDAGNPLKVGSRSYDQSSAWSALSAAGDRANLMSDVYRRVIVADYPNISTSASAVSVTDSEVLLGTAIAGRERILIQNNGSLPIYVGPTGVSTSTGIIVGRGATMDIPLGESLDLYGIAASGTHDVRILQLA